MGIGAGFWWRDALPHQPVNSSFECIGVLRCLELSEEWVEQCRWWSQCYRCFFPNRMCNCIYQLKSACFRRKEKWNCVMVWLKSWNTKERWLKTNDRRWNWREVSRCLLLNPSQIYLTGDAEVHFRLTRSTFQPSSLSSTFGVFRRGSHSG